VLVQRLGRCNGIFYRFKLFVRLITLTAQPERTGLVYIVLITIVKTIKTLEGLYK